MAIRMTGAGLRAIALGSLLALAACQTGSKIAGEGSGASQSGVAYMQAVRAEYGLPPLRPDATLEAAALQQAKYMASAGRMSHTTSWGRDFATRMREGGVNGRAAENIAFGGMDTAKVFSMWMNSAGHRRNMLNPAYSKFGLAYVREGGGGDRRYWALVLGN